MLIPPFILSLSVQIDHILPYVQLDLVSLSEKINAMDWSMARNKSELQLQREFENGTPAQRILYVPMSINLPIIHEDECIESFECLLSG